MAYKLYGIQTPLIEYIHKIDEFSTMSHLLLFFSKISLPPILVKKKLRKLKKNDYIKIKTNDDSILSGKLLSKNSETICICVDRISNKSLYEYYREFLNIEERIKYHKDQSFEIRHIKKICE